MDIVVVGRNTEVPEQFRSRIEQKLARVEHLAPASQRVDVVITHQRNPRRADHAERVELTVRGAGPVVRAEASAPDRYAALDVAVAKLSERMRRVRDRQKGRRRAGNGLGTLPLEPVVAAPPVAPVAEATPPEPTTPSKPGQETETQIGDSPVIVRQKLYEATSMSVDQALYQMELVGHPFYLFIDEETGQPCVVYHRHGWTYGVIRLDAVVSN